MIDAEQRFVLACNELGWGDPQGGLWFLGIEEGSEWPPRSEQEIESYYAQGRYFRRVEDDDHSITQPKNRSRITSVETQIAAPLSQFGRVAGVSEYEKRIWLTGSKVAHANLYPLGKRRLSHWPQHYQELFGLADTPSDHERYLQRVRTERFARLAAARDELQPQAIVCFGRSYWADFRAALRLPADHELQDANNVLVFDHDRVLLASHFAYGHLTHAMAEFVSATLCNWRVDLP